MTDFRRQLKRNEGNCFLWGCATVTLVIVLGSIVAFLTARYYIGQLREQYTDDAPVDLPVVEIDEDELAALIERTDAFSQSMRDDEPNVPLTLTQDEINALIQNHPDLEKFNGRVYVTIEDDEFTGQVSAPLDIFPGFGGRYFNGSATFDVGIENGKLSVFVESATLKGEALPETFMQGIREQDLVQNLSDDPDFEELVAKIDSLVVADGAITITPANLTGDLPSSRPTDRTQEVKENEEVKSRSEGTPTRSPETSTDDSTREAVWIMSGKDAVKSKLKDPGSALFRNVFFSRGKEGIPVTCGEVNSKNSFGGFSGYQRFVSGGSDELTFLEEEAEDFGTVWEQLCVE